MEKYIIQVRLLTFLLLRGGRGVKVGLRLLQPLSILLFMAGEPEKLGRLKYLSLESFFERFLNMQVSEVLGKHYPD